MSPSFLPEALDLARKARRNFPRDQVQPQELWAAAFRDVQRATPGALEIGAHYRHAMTEAGMLVEAVSRRPYLTCPDCGWNLEG